MILSIRKLACAIAAAYVAPPGEAGAVDIEGAGAGPAVEAARG
jgi:hypothetical protein